jgi:hypothetical protein
MKYALAMVLCLSGLMISFSKAQDSSDPEYLRAVSTLYASGIVASIIKDWCDIKVPDSKSVTAKALEIWRKANRMPEIEARFTALLGAEKRSQINTNLEGKRDTMYENLEKSIQNPQQDCQNFDGFLKKNMNVQQEYAAEYKLVFSQPAPTKPNTQNPNPTPQTTNARDVLYTPAQLSALYYSVKDKTPGKSNQKWEAAEKAILALGTVFVIGQPDNANVMSYQTARGTTKLDVSCLFAGDDTFESRDLIGKTVVIRGRTTNVSRSFVNFRDCEVINQSQVSSLKKSTQTEDGGMDYSAGAVLAGINKGIKASQIDGVYLEQGYEMGAGGYSYVKYSPVLMLKDGWAYDGWLGTPSDLSIVLSKKLEPNGWRRYERKGNQIRIQGQDGKWSSFSKWNKVEPAKAGDKLLGTFTRLSGGGNTAFGGDTMIAVFSSYTFKKDGTFTTDRGSSASGGQEATNPNGTPAVVTTSNSNSSGTYKLDGYTLELKYGNGKVDRKGFVWFDERQKDSIFINGTAFLLKK